MCVRQLLVSFSYASTRDPIGGTQDGRFEYQGCGDTSRTRRSAHFRPGEACTKPCKSVLPALVIALLVGGIVYAVRGSATPVYQSDIVAEVQSASQIVVTDANLGQLVAPYVALATDSDVVAAIHDQLNNGWTTADVSSHISVTPGTSPALVFVKATAFSQADADALARIVVATLSDAQARRNADTLDRRTRVLTDDIARLNGDLDAARRESLDEYETPADDPTIKADLDARLEQLRQLRSTVSGSDRLQLLSAPRERVCRLRRSHSSSRRLRSWWSSFSLPKSSLPAGVDSVRE